MQLAQSSFWNFKNYLHLHKSGYIFFSILFHFYSSIYKFRIISYFPIEICHMKNMILTSGLHCVTCADGFIINKTIGTTLIFKIGFCTLLENNRSIQRSFALFAAKAFVLRHVVHTFNKFKIKWFITCVQARVSFLDRAWFTGAWPTQIFPPTVEIS